MRIKKKMKKNITLKTTILHSRIALSMQVIKLVISLVVLSHNSLVTSLYSSLLIFSAISQIYFLFRKFSLSSFSKICLFSDIIPLSLGLVLLDTSSSWPFFLLPFFLGYAAWMGGKIYSKRIFSYISFFLISHALYVFTVTEVNLHYVIDTYLMSLVSSLFVFLFFQDKLRSFDYSIGKKELTSEEITTLMLPRYNPSPVMQFDGKEFTLFNDVARDLMKNISKTELKQLTEIFTALMHNDQYGDHSIIVDIGDRIYKIYYVLVQGQFNLYFQEVSDLVQAQREAMDKEYYAMALVNAIPGFVSWIDNEMRYLGVNSQMSNFIGLKPSEIIGNKLGEMAPDGVEGQSGIRPYVEEFLASSLETSQQELRMQVAGKEVVLLLSMSKYNQGNNAILISIDITDLRTIERLLDEEKKRVETSARLASFGEMTAGIAHEINNSLAVISASNMKLDRLLQKGDLRLEVLQKSNNTITKSVNTIVKIIKGMKNLSRDGENDPFEFVELTEIINDAFAIVEKKCESKGIDLRLVNDAENLLVECQQVQISQMIVILVNNAIDAIFDLTERWIQIELAEEGENLRISVIDSGSGISRELAEKIFTPFYTLKSVGKGTGLGLSLARKMSAAHGGDISIDSEAKNTKFDIVIPIRHSSISEAA